MITKIRKYISNVIFPWDSILNRSFDLNDDLEDIIKEKNSLINQQSDHANNLIHKIDSMYDMFLQMAKVAIDSNSMIQVQFEKEKEQMRIEKELTEEINRLKVVN
jgi:ElaB/YqjD/DUF883 family membrane-anchored ribosome-binding protein